MNNNTIALGLLAVFTMLAGAGCSRSDGPPRVSAKGTVVFDGRPLEQGVIRFVPTGETTGPKAAASIEQGVFKFPKGYGPVPGTHRVEIEATAADLPDPDNEAAVAAYLIEQKRSRPAPQIPPSYNRHSRLEETVTSEGPNEFAFELVSK